MRLRDKGNTVLIIEHKPELIAIADHVVDLGPGAGTAGGEICYQGDLTGLRASDTVTGRHLDDRARLKASVRTPSGKLEIRGATNHNLRDVDVDLPLGVLTVLTGVAGSGKSSLIDVAVAPRDDVVLIDQGAIRGSRRSNPATYTGLLEPIRKAFAKANGVKPALFSANSEGACPACNGSGVIYTDLGMMAGVETTCEVCEGKRFLAEVLSYRLGGRNIAEVLDLPVSEALDFFDHDAPVPPARTILERLESVGLGYLRLGQPLTTLSGGERQRLKLAAQLPSFGAVYVLDEPTVGLHLADVQQLLGLPRPPGRFREVGDRDRAPPSGDGPRRLDHRPRPGRRPRRRTHRLQWHPGAVGRSQVHPHREASGQLRVGLTTQSRPEVATTSPGG